MERFIILSGCSGGGKSTLLSHLAARGFATVDEPGRRIVRAQMQAGGKALPWLDLPGFLIETAALAKSDYRTASAASCLTFFDRSLIDAASGLRNLGDDDLFQSLRHEFRYDKAVFLTPPWPEIYRKDAERHHDFDDAVAEYERLLRDYEALGYALHILPTAPVEDRAAYILDVLQDG